MNAQGCLRILRDVKDVAFATVDEKGFEISEACIGCGNAEKSALNNVSVQESRLKSIKITAFTAVCALKTAP